ncbi:MAG TPA: hypothetical protein PLK11_07110 [Methanofastidiosum sp.]|nr:hypothetical protein [Methanofastidiosum sp.]HOR87650.1 hypothetical protein [Methanofastidiosum sp.]HOT84898.1 hypothetical protein [Methanofastidiosum sp.]HPL01096.1 hypothetical protein [Methanofastidiosum sp.]HQF89419.1 hypothetical protein [Methanofastidiosum sp.]
MVRRTHFVVLGLILLIIAGGLFYYTTIPFERTITTQEYVTKERIEILERVVPKEKLVKKTRDVTVYADTTIADSSKEFQRDDYITLGEVLLKPNDRIKFTVTTDPNKREIEREFEFKILDNSNYELWLTQQQPKMVFYNAPPKTIELNDVWTVPAGTGIQQYKIVLSNRMFAYSKKITYLIIKQESSTKREEYLETVIENVTETYEEKVPYQELETITKRERFWHDEYRPISYILGAFGILGILIGMLTYTQREKIKRIPGVRQITRTPSEPVSLPKCPICGSKVAPTHIMENRKKIYKCTYCGRLLELD